MPAGTAELATWTKSRLLSKVGDAEQGDAPNATSTEVVLSPVAPARLVRRTREITPQELPRRRRTLQMPLPPSRDRDDNTKKWLEWATHGGEPNRSLERATAANLSRCRLRQVLLRLRLTLKRRDLIWIDANHQVVDMIVDLGEPMSRTRRDDQHVSGLKLIGHSVADV